MRLFLALELPAALRAELTDRTRRVRGSASKARWIPAENLHVTLCFLGDVAPERLPPFHAALAAVCAETPALTLRFTSCGVFPPRGKARVLWAGLDAPDSLARLQKLLAEAAENLLGVLPEKRPFRGHVTLARCDPPWSPSDARRALEHPALAFDETLRAPFEASEVVLFASELLPAGARYRVVRAYPFSRGVSGECRP